MHDTDTNKGGILFYTLNSQYIKWGMYRKYYQGRKSSHSYLELTNLFRGEGNSNKKWFTFIREYISVKTINTH